MMLQIKASPRACSSVRPLKRCAAEITTKAREAANRKRLHQKPKFIVFPLRDPYLPKPFKKPLDLTQFAHDPFPMKRAATRNDDSELYCVTRLFSCLIPNDAIIVAST